MAFYAAINLSSGATNSVIFKWHSKLQLFIYSNSFVAWKKECMRALQAYQIRSQSDTCTTDANQENSVPLVPDDEYSSGQISWLTFIRNMSAANYAALICVITNFDAVSQPFFTAFSTVNLRIGILDTITSEFLVNWKEMARVFVASIVRENGTVGDLSSENDDEDEEAKETLSEERIRVALGVVQEAIVEATGHVVAISHKLSDAKDELAKLLTVKDSLHSRLREI